eukprot:scaffold317865_cov17-Prasinocladus_malaysianus.AAC.1
MFKRCRQSQGKAYAGVCYAGDRSLRPASKGVAKRSKQEAWQGTRIKTSAADGKAKKMRREAVIGPSLGGLKSKGFASGGRRGSAKAQAAAGTGGTPRDKGKRPAVALKKAKQARTRDATAAGGSSRGSGPTRGKTASAAKKGSSKKGGRPRKFELILFKLSELNHPGTCVAMHVNLDKHLPLQPAANQTPDNYNCLSVGIRSLAASADGEIQFILPQY